MLTALSPTVPVLFRRLLPVALLALPLAPLGAQTAPTAANPTPAATAPSADTSLKFAAQALYEHIFSAHMNSGGTGSLSTNTFTIGLQHTLDLEADHFKIDAGYGYENYDFSGGPPPFGDVQRPGASLLYLHDINPDWGAIGYLQAGFSAATAASFGDGGQVALAAGPSYNFSKVLTVSAGPMFYSRLEDENTVTIYAQAKWDFLPQWELHAYAGINNGATVSYDVFGNQATVAEATLEYTSRWFRLQDAPGVTQAVNESYGTFKVGVRQALSENYFVRGYLAYVFSREYQLHVNGNSASSFNVDSSWGIGIAVGAAF